MLTFPRKLKLQVIAVAVAAAVGSQVGVVGKPSLNSQLKSVEGKIRQVKGKIAEKEGQKRTIIGQLNATERELESAQSSLSQNKLRLLDAQADLKATIERLERTQRHLERRQDLLTRRVVDIYQGEDLNYADVVLGASDMWSFLTRAYYLKRILDSDTVLIKQIQEDKANIERDKVRQAQRVAEIESLQGRLLQERNRIAALADARRQQIEEIENDKEKYERALEELERQSQRIEDSIQRYQNTPKGRARYAKAFTGGLSWPVSGRVTSNFGYRVHPITGVYKLHTGVDIAAPSGTPIQAAADGVVIISGWQGAYGQAVVIDHGGGVSTLYGHCSKLLVRANQKVSKGQKIALVGSTGYSTGPHCHFEKRINGKPVNPGS